MMVNQAPIIAFQVFHQNLRDFRPISTRTRIKFKKERNDAGKDSVSSLKTQVPMKTAFKSYLERDEKEVNEFRAPATF